MTFKVQRDSEIQSNIREQSKTQSDWQGPKQRSFIKSARVPFATFRSNLSSGLNCWDHSHMGCEPVTLTHGLQHDKNSEQVRGNATTQQRGLCHSKNSGQAGCIASTQPNSTETCIAFQMMANEHKHLIKNKTGSIFQLIVGFKANANLKITNGITFDKVVSHQVNVAMKHGIDYNGNNPLQQ